MVHLEYYENKQPRVCFLLDFAALLGMCATETTFFLRAEGFI